jgi:hypothetical protein
MRSRCAMDADLRPTAPNDSLVWGGVQQMSFDPPQFVE